MMFNTSLEKSNITKQTQTHSHLPSYGNEHDVYENHVVWSTPATAAFTVPGGLWAIMSHFSEVKAPSTHDMIKCTNSNSVKSRNYALRSSPVLFESLLCSRTQQILLKWTPWVCNKVSFLSGDKLIHNICSQWDFYVLLVFTFERLMLTRRDVMWKME